ncbi:MAG: glycosyltransferase family 2 protein [Bacteroidales bacterium]
MIYLFFILLFIVFYTYIGYGIVLYIIVKIKECIYPAETSHTYTEWPSVSLLIAAYNEEDIIESKMENCFALDYPADKLHIIWVTDGSTDHTNELLQQYDRVKVLFSPERKGKTAAINRAMPLIETPLTIYTDANTMLNRQAIKEIALQFADPTVGCVAGEKRVIAGDEKESASVGEGLYWKYESFLKDLDSRLYSVVGAAGELFAIRTSFYIPMPADTLLDDFIQSLRIAMSGHRTSYCKMAYACEKGSENIEEEKKRKIRIAAGGLQSVYRLRSLLNPFRYGVLSFQYISHRVLRWTLTPVALVLLLPLNIYLCISTGNHWIILILILQILFYLAAIAGYAGSVKDRPVRILYAIYYFVFMNLNVFRGYIYLRKRRGNGTWDKAKRSK